MKKLCSIILSILMIICFVGTGCKEKEENLPPEVEITYTDNFLLKDGKSDYCLVTPKQPSAMENLAVTEFNEIFKLSSGITLPVMKETDIQYNQTSKYIFIGQVNCLSDFDINPLISEIGEQGYIIKTVDSSVVITSATDYYYGTLYGVYEFLSMQIGFEQYTDDETYVDEYSELKLINVNIKDKPDIANNIYANKAYETNATFRFRNRYVSVIDLYKGKTTPYHSSFVYLPPAQYYNDNPEWYFNVGENGVYSHINAQLCYTAHGNQIKWQKMVDTLFETFKQILEEDDEVMHFGFCMQDTTNWCNCDACKKSLSDYGANSASIIIFLNAVSDKFAEYFENNNITRKIDFVFFAYKETFPAPATKQADGTYKANDSMVVCRDNVFPFVCTFNANRALSFTDERADKSTVETINAWKALSKQVSFWTYTDNYNDFLIPRDSISYMQENYRFLAQTNPLFLKEESQTKNYNSTGFGCFQRWLSYKLAWDVNSDVTSLTDEFFTRYFQVAKEPMKKYFDEYLLTLAHITSKYGYSQYDSFVAMKKHYLPYGTLVKWQGYINEAYQSIEFLKDTNKELYNKLYQRITIESVTITYSLIKLHSEFFSDKELEFMKKKVVDDCSLSKIYSFKDDLNATLDKLYA